LSYPYREVVELPDISYQPFIVAKRKVNNVVYGDSFVAIFEWMVFNHEIKSVLALVRNPGYRNFPPKV